MTGRRKKSPSRPPHRWMTLPVEAYTHELEVECTEEEADIIRARAAAAGMDVEEYMYACLFAQGNA